MFERTPACFIAWGLNLDHPAPARRKSFSVEQVWSRSDGTILARQTLQAHVDPGWMSSYHHQREPTPTSGATYANRAAAYYSKGDQDRDAR